MLIFERLYRWKPLKHMLRLIKKEGKATVEDIVNKLGGEMKFLDKYHG